MMILNVTKNQGFTVSLKNTFLEKPKGRGQIGPPSLFKVKKDLRQVEWADTVNLQLSNVSPSFKNFNQN